MIEAGVDSRHPGCTAYALGGFAIGALSAAPAVLLLYYMTQLLGLPPLWASAILIAPKGAALLWDPLLGRMLDRLGTSRTKRLVFYATGLVVAPLALALALAAPQLPPVGLALYVGITYALHVAGYSILSIGHAAATAALASGEGERIRWSAARARFVLTGIIAGAGLAPIALGLIGGGRAAQAIVGMGVALLCLAAGLVPLLGARVALTASTVVSTRLRLRPELVRLFLAYLAITTANGVGSAAVPLWVAQWLGRPAGDSGLLLLALLLAATLAVPSWHRLGARVGTGRALTISIIAQISGLVLLCALIASGTWPAILCGFLFLGCAFGGLQVLPFALIAQAIRGQADEGGTGEGAAIGIWAAVEKLSLGAGPALTGLVLAANAGHAGIAFVAAVTLLGTALLLGAAAAVPRPEHITGNAPAT